MPPSNKPYVRKIMAVAAVMAIVAAGYAWLDGGSGRLDAMALRRLGDGGRVEVVRGDDVVVVRDTVGLAPGDVVRTSGGARARLRLDDGRDAWLSDGAEVVVTSGSALAIRSGGVLARAEDPTTLTVGDVAARAGSSLFRVDALEASARVASYDGAVALRAPGRPEARLEPLFQAAVAADQLAAPRPYRIEPADPWDRTRLAPVVELHERLTRLSDRFAGAGVRPVVPERALRDRRPADAAIAVALARTAAAPFDTALRRALELRDAGGQWAVVAAIMDVEPRPLVALLDDVLVAAGVADPAATVTGETPAASGEPTDAPAPAAAAAPSGGDAPPARTGGTRTDDPVDGGGGGGGGGGDEPECDNEVDCILPALPTPSSLLDDPGGGS